MDIPETLATMGNKTQHEDKKKHKNTIQQRKPKRPGMNPGARKGLAVPSFYKTPTMLIIKVYTKKILLKMDKIDWDMDIS